MEQYIESKQNLVVQTNTKSLQAMGSVFISLVAPLKCVQIVTERSYYRQIFSDVNIPLVQRCLSRRV